jgi:hypothetical protein
LHFCLTMSFDRSNESFALGLYIPGAASSLPWPSSLSHAYNHVSPLDTSFSNEGNAHFTVQLVIQLYRNDNMLDARDLSRRGSVLIITPYILCTEELL